MQHISNVLSTKYKLKIQPEKTTDMDFSGLPKSQILAEGL